METIFNLPSPPSADIIEARRMAWSTSSLSSSSRTIGSMALFGAAGEAARQAAPAMTGVPGEGGTAGEGFRSIVGMAAER